MREDIPFLLKGEAMLISRKQTGTQRRAIPAPKAAKKKADGASAGNGRRPQPRFLRRRFRFCPAAIRKASQLTRQSHRKRKRRMPCQSLASANNGSTQTLRLRKAFLYASVDW